MATTDRIRGSWKQGVWPWTRGKRDARLRSRAAGLQSSGRDKQFLVIAVLVVSGIGLVASLYIVPWGDSLGNRSVMLAGTWLFLIAGLIWLGAFIALTWWVARDVGNLVGRLAKGIRRLAPKC